MKTRLLYLSLLFLCLTSCDKTGDPVPENENQFTIKLKSPAPSITEFEVLISQQDGEILLDTVLNTSIANHVLLVKSNYAKLNITTVTKYIDIDPAYFAISTFTQVDPTNWEISNTFENFDLVKTYSNSTKIYSVIRYTLPEYDEVSEPFGGRYFAATNNSGFSTTYSANTLSVNYDRTLPTSQTYLLLPEIGKYLFKEVSTGDVSLDLADARDIVKHNFAIPQSFKLQSVVLNGYQQADVYKDPLEIFNTGRMNTNYPSYNKSPYHLLYPGQLFEEYELRIGLADDYNNQYLYYSVVKDIPEELNLVAKPKYTIAAKTFKDFRIEFPSEKPTYYSLTLSSEREKLFSSWSVQLPAGTTTFNAESFLKNLSPKLLKEEDITSFSPRRITFTNATNFNYQEFFSYVFSPEKLKEKKLKQYLRVNANL